VADLGVVSAQQANGFVMALLNESAKVTTC
jgi:hypothetical protein